MCIKLLFLPFFLNLVHVESKNSYMESKITGGEKTNITKYPHSVFIFVVLNSGAFVCGSSIVNQNILLTAAHCLSACLHNKCKIEVFAGNSNKREGYKFKVFGYRIHERYTDKAVANDIALIRVKWALPLGKVMKRVALLKKLPRKKVALVAGWGIVNEEKNTHTEWLHHTKQRVWSLSRCRQILRNVPDGCICGGKEKSTSYVSRGDSGSALVIDGYIQIGIVSFKRPDVTKSLVVYTDVTYFYKWIKRNVKGLMCLIK